MMLFCLLATRCRSLTITKRKLVKLNSSEVRFVLLVVFFFFFVLGVGNKYLGFCTSDLCSGLVSIASMALENATHSIDPDTASNYTFVIKSFSINLPFLRDDIIS